MHTDIHTYTYIYIHIHTYTYIYIRIHTYTYIYTHIHTYIHAYRHAYRYTYIYLEIQSSPGGQFFICIIGVTTSITARIVLASAEVGLSISSILSRRLCRCSGATTRTELSRVHLVRTRSTTLHRGRSREILRSKGMVSALRPMRPPNTLER